MGQAHSVWNDSDDEDHLELLGDILGHLEPTNGDQHLSMISTIITDFKKKSPVNELTQFMMVGNQS